MHEKQHNENSYWWAWLHVTNQSSFRDAGTLRFYLYCFEKKHMTNDLILSNVKEHNSITKIRSNISFAKIFFMIIMTYTESLISTIYEH